MWRWAATLWVSGVSASELQGECGMAYLRDGTSRGVGSLSGSGWSHGTLEHYRLVNDSIIREPKDGLDYSGFNRMYILCISKGL